jgi:ribosomal protein S18 acetylase RimI-like enzyme
MSFTVRYAGLEDIAALRELDRWPKEAAWQHKIRAEEVIVATRAEMLVGLIRFEVLWTTVPFMSLILVCPECRGQGVSRLLLGFLESELKRRGYMALLSSSQTNEPEPQAWHRHMGFQENGLIEHIADEGVGELVFRKLL